MKYRVAALLLSFAVFAVLLNRPAVAQPQPQPRAYLPLAVGRPSFSATPVGGGFRQVTEVTHAGDERLFVAERAGLVKILHPDGRITTFLDISNRVISSRGEYGFYDIAFHPGYADPSSPGYGFFYVSYTTGFDDGVTLFVHFVVSRFRVSADPDVADPASETLLMYEKQSFDLHKGGGMEFDTRDNRLYVGLGDDRLLLIAQSDRSPKGKIVRFDVDKVPRDARGAATLPEEIWVFGLRNPWRFDVDVAGGQIFIGEVGDQQWEEVNLAPLSLPGFNFGWPCLEGPYVFPETNEVPECQSPWLFKRAIHEYPHRDGSGRCAVMAGKVNRPEYNPADGRFVFADMCTREVFTLARDSQGAWQRTLQGILNTDLVTTIGEDRHGFQYVGTAAESAPIYRLYVP